MLVSVDGRINGGEWGLADSARYFEEPAAKIEVDAWLVGRTTMQEFSSKRARPRRGRRYRVPSGDFVARRAKTYAVVIDPSGKCRWDSDRVSTEHVIEVLSERVSAEYLDHLRARGVSYLFAGKRELDLELALTKLRALFGIERVRIDGGGHVNGAFLKAGLIDEFSMVLAPFAVGWSDALAVFEAARGRGQKATRFALTSVKRIHGDFVWLRYRTVRRA